LNYIKSIFFSFFYYKLKAQLYQPTVEDETHRQHLYYSSPFNILSLLWRGRIKEGEEIKLIKNEPDYFPYFFSNLGF